MWKFLLKKKIKLVNNVLFLENFKGYFFEVFHGLLLFGRLLLFIFDRIPRAILILGANTIWQVRVPSISNCPMSWSFMQFLNMDFRNEVSTFCWMSITTLLYGGDIHKPWQKYLLDVLKMCRIFCKWLLILCNCWVALHVIGWLYSAEL